MRERTDILGRDGYTWWVGEVEDNNDPSKLGRVRVRILGWYTGHKAKEDYVKEIPTKVLPCQPPPSTLHLPPSLHVA